MENIRYESREKMNNSDNDERHYHVKYSDTMTADELIDSIRDVIQEVLNNSSKQ